MEIREEKMNNLTQRQKIVAIGFVIFCLLWAAFGLFLLIGGGILNGRPYSFVLGIVLLIQAGYWLLKILG